MGYELDLNILSNYKISKYGVANFIVSYIPIRENTDNTNDSFGGIVIRKIITSEK